MTIVTLSDWINHEKVRLRFLIGKSSVHFKKKSCQCYSSVWRFIQRNRRNCAAALCQIETRLQRSSELLKRKQQQ